jgi:hypothetical protein
MFGGGEPGAHFDDLWMWDGNDWTFVPAGTPPKARSSPVMFAGSGGLVVFAGLGTNPNGGNVPLKDSWRMRWDGSTTGEVCETADSDGDTLAGCTDPDCWARCTPTCPPGTSCAAGGSRCGDGTCNAALEDCWLCPADCGACTARCGDFACAGTESHATCPGDCP